MQVNPGDMCDKGLGVLADFVTANMGSNIASASGDETGAENKELISNRMTSEDISKARAMARVCINNNYEKCGY